MRTISPIVAIAIIVIASLGIHGTISAKVSGGTLLGLSLFSGAGGPLLILFSILTLTETVSPVVSGIIGIVAAILTLGNGKIAERLSPPPPYSPPPSYDVAQNYP